MIRYYCPECHAPIEVDDSKAGRAYDCPLCGKTGLVPGGAAKAAGKPPLPTVQAPSEQPLPKEAPLPAAAASSAQERGGEPMNSFWWGFFIPVVGLVRAAMQAFDPDPTVKRRTGYSLGGMIAGVAVMGVVGGAILPMLVGGVGGPAYNEGVEAMQAEQWTKAAMKFREAVRDSPDFAPAWFNLAICSAKGGDSVGAEDQAKHAVTLVDRGKNRGLPDGSTEAEFRHKVHGFHALTLVDLQRFDEAKAEARIALQAQPDGPFAPNLRPLVSLP